MALFSSLPARRVAALVAVALACAPGGAASCRAQEADPLAVALTLEKAFVKVIQDAEASVVSIARYKPAPPPREGVFDPRRIEQIREAQQPGSPDFVPNDFGAGVIFAPSWNPAERFILTNYHVVRGGPVVRSAAEKPVGVRFGAEKPDGERTNADKPDDFRLYVKYTNRRGHETRIVAADPRSDLAVLQIDGAALGVGKEELRPIVWATQPEIRKGQFALALGNPYAVARDGSPTASWGMIANISRRPAPAGSIFDDEARRRETIHHFGTLLQVDTRLSVGTSGGPVLNLKGELIGLATSLAALDGYEKSVGYAIPLDGPMRRIVDDLARGYEVEYGFLGIGLIDLDGDELRRQYPDVKSPGAVVADRVLIDSPAALGGMQPRDVVLAVNGTPVSGRYDLMRLVGLIGPEATVTLRVLRERPRPREIQLSVRLGKWPVADDEGIIASAARREPWRGLTVDYSTSRLKHLPQDARYYRAVMVTKIDSAGPKPDLSPGDLIARVNGTAVSTPAEFEKAVRGLDGDATLELTDGRKVVIRR